MTDMTKKLIELKARGERADKIAAQLRDGFSKPATPQSNDGPEGWDKCLRIDLYDPLDDIAKERALDMVASKLERDNARPIEFTHGRTPDGPYSLLVRYELVESEVRAA